VTVSGIEAEYGDVTTESITIELEVSDCSGGWDTDTIEIVFECEGT
jgi:hypothetical protein